MFKRPFGIININIEIGNKSKYQQEMIKTKIKFILIFISLLYSCGKVPTIEPNESFQHFIGDFEMGNLNGFHFLVPDTAVNTKVVTNPVRKGNYALKNTLNPEDYINNGYRAELAIYNCAKYKTDVFYAFSFMIDSTYLDEEYNLICQWQDLPYYEQGEAWEPTPDIRVSSPPIALIYVNGNIEVKMNENPASNNHTYLVGKTIKIDKGNWNDVIAHIYWSDDNTAYTEISLNGDFITPFNGIDHKYYNRNLYNRAGNYFKFGQYRGKDKTKKSNIIYFDEVKIGSTLTEVAL